MTRKKITKHAQIAKHLKKYPMACHGADGVREVAEKFNCTASYVYKAHDKLFGPKRGAKVETPVAKTKVVSRQDALEEQLIVQANVQGTGIARLIKHNKRLWEEAEEKDKEKDKDMTITRAELLKELLPGLNALFGMEYSKYGEEHEEIFKAAASPTTTRGDILDTAKQYITKDRAEEHGDLASNFSTIAAYWSTHLNTAVSATDVAVMMNLVKIARIKSNPANMDNWIDGCGYLACGGELVGGVR